MGKSCNGVTERLLECLAKTPCVQQGGSYKECAGDPGVPEECKSLRAFLAECNRQKVDMRKRIRGQKVRAWCLRGATYLGSGRALAPQARDLALLALSRECVHARLTSDPV